LHEKGYNIKLLVRETSDISPFNGLKNIEYIIGDVRDIDSIYKAVNNVDVIYHLAAYTGIWAKDKSIYEDINVKGTENVSKVALEKNKRLLYMSSFTAIGPTPKGGEEPVDESYEETSSFHMEYEKTKYQGKKVVKEYIKKGLNANLFYPGIVFGPGDFNIFGQMLLDIVNGKFLGCPGKGDSIACFTYVNDLVDVMVKALDKEDIRGENFILGGENIEFGKYLDLIAEIANVKKPRHFPMSGAMMYARLCEFKANMTGKMPYITRPTLESIKYNREYSSKKAIEKLGYKITPIREALEETIEWYKNYIESNQKKKNNKK
jgi:dihydroflavonol-4-reductase